MTINEVAKAMRKSPAFVRIGLQRGLLPFGSAVKVSDHRYSYHVSEEAFRRYMRGI